METTTNLVNFNRCQHFSVISECIYNKLVPKKLKFSDFHTHGKTWLHKTSWGWSLKLLAVISVLETSNRGANVYGNFLPLLAVGWNYDKYWQWPSAEVGLALLQPQAGPQVDKRQAVAHWIYHTFQLPWAMKAFIKEMLGFDYWQVCEEKWGRQA